MHDPLTEAIFGDLPAGRQNSDEAKEGIFVREEEVDALTEAIFARLDLSAPVKPTPRLAKDELTRESILREIEGLSHTELAAFEAQFISRPLPRRRPPQQAMLARASDDWFQVRSVPKPAAPLFKIERPKPRRIIFPAIVLGFLIVGGTLAATQGFSSRKLQGTSFALLNAEQDLVFPPVARLAADLRNLSQDLITRAKEDASRKKEFLAMAEEAEAIQEILDEFFEANRNFSWLNIFRVVSPAYPQSLSRLAQAVERAEVLNLKTPELQQYLGWLGFWERLLTQDGQYLIIGETDWAVLEVLGGRASIHSTGRVSELNAALTAKTIPPAAVQVSKTNFDFYETDWFLDSQTQGEIISRLFSATTQTNVDGVFLVSAAEIFELITTLANTADWRILERILKNALETHGLQLFFRDAKLQSFVEKENLVQNLELEQGEDGLAINLRFWEGDFDVESVEYSPEFFVDGSVVSKLNVRLKNLGSKARSAYLKIYLPLGSDVLEAAGFTARRPPPKFDYEGEEFQTLVELLPVQNDSAKFAQLDFYQEGGFLAVGGWVRLEAGRSGQITLEYRLPFRLNWQKGSDTYQLKVFKPGNINELPFVFIPPTNEEIGFQPLEPLGETIQAQIIFK